VGSFSKKQLKFIFRIDQGTFDNSKTNTLEFVGLRASVQIGKVGAAQMSSATCEIFGLAQSEMNALTVVQWSKNWLGKNTIEIYALDDDNTYTTLVFAGNVINAFGDYTNMPDVALYVHAQNAYYDNQKPYAVTTFKGSVDAATAIEKICKNLGYHFENNGVNVKINNLYAWNSGIQQIRDIAIAGGFDVYFDDKTVSITRSGQPRFDYKCDVSPTTGMIGYPTFDGWGVTVWVNFNPLLTYGGTINVQSELPNANGIWKVVSLIYILESQMPDGQFLCIVRGQNVDTAITQ
jgi:hypothetical protein